MQFVCQSKLKMQRLYNRLSWTRQLTSLGIEARSFCSKAVPEARLIIPGFATPEATTNFVTNAGLPISHRFKQSQLCVSPVIHGPPIRFLPKEDDMELLAYALVENGSNCVYVYEHQSGSYGVRQHKDSLRTGKRVPGNTDWFQRGLKEVMDVANVDREQLVTIAGLGSFPKNLTSSQGLHGISTVLKDRLASACRLTGLRRIDFAMIELHGHDIERQLNVLENALQWLDAAVRAGVLQGYGVLIDVLPYTVHTPPQTQTGPSITLPSSLELHLSQTESRCEMVAYSMSPTTSTPATYPMLPASLDQLPKEYRTQEDEDQDRRLTRVAVDSFLARRGRRDLDGNTDENDDADDTRIDPANDDLHQGEPFLLISYPKGDKGEEQGEEDYMAELIGKELDTLCPPLASSRRLQDKVLRTMMSVGIDCIIADAELAQLLGQPDVRPDQLLSSDDTDDIFGTFMLPAELTEDERYEDEI